MILDWESEMEVDACWEMSAMTVAELWRECRKVLELMPECGLAETLDMLRELKEFHSERERQMEFVGPPRPVYNQTCEKYRMVLIEDCVPENGIQNPQVHHHPERLYGESDYDDFGL